MAKKQKSPTISAYKKWKLTGSAFWLGKYLLPITPATVITAINWNDWFVDAGASLPMGFASLLISVLVTIISIAKKDDLVEKNVSSLFFIAGIMAVWAISFMFLANILQQMGQMLLFTVAGIVGGGITDQLDMKLAKPRIAEYKKLIEENGLDKRSQKKIVREQKAKEEAENIGTGLL